MVKISLDLDNTIFEWTNHYESKFGIPKTDLEITRNVVGPLRKDKKFWMSQPVINYPNFTPWCYCTSRVIKKEWIKEQLFKNNLPKAPIYQVHGVALSKYNQLKKASINCHVDDSISVFKDLNLKGIPCLLLDSPYNQEWGPVGRVYNLDREEIEEAFYLFAKTILPYFKELV